MRKLSLFLTIATVLVFSASLFAQVNDVYITGVTNTFDKVLQTAGNWQTDKYLIGDKDISVTIHFDATDGAGYTWLGTNAFQLYNDTLWDGSTATAEDADWGFFQAERLDYIWNLPLKYSTDIGCLALESFLKHGYKVGGSGVFETTADGPDITKCFCFTPPCEIPDLYTSVPTGGNVNGNDTVAFYHAAVGQGVGYGGGTEGDAFTATFHVSLADTGKVLCFDTCAQYQAWEWAAAGWPDNNGSDFPTWDNGQGVDGPICWEIGLPENIKPLWCDDQGGQGTEDLSGSVTFNHCGEGTFDLCAYDPDNTDAITYEFASGFETGYGTLDANTGVWTWSGSTVPQEDDVAIEFVAYDGQDYTDNVFTLNVTTTNNAPTVSCVAGPLTVSVETTKAQGFSFDDVDVCDAPTVTVTMSGNEAGDVATVVGNTVEFTPANEGAARLVTTTVHVNDGVAEATCDLTWNVIFGAPYQIKIEKLADVIQGQFEDVAVELMKYDFTQGLGGFDLLIAYDASALVFQLATEGDIYTDCAWEYFTYRYGPYGNCGSACPSGMLAIYGMAESNNGPVHPGCDGGGIGYIDAAPKVLAYLRFLVSNDATLECQYVPIRFYWYDCTNNILSNHDGSEAYLSQKVFDFYDYDDYFSQNEITGDGTQSFPTYQGARDECIYENEQLGKIAKRNVDFQNGGIDIICADSIDARGDINLNGLAHEIADAVMFTNYFIDGISAFGTHIDGSIAASDVNADGITLSVADLVYLIRVIIGDALPYDKIAPVVANVTYGNGVLSVDGAMGAAHIVVAGDVSPRLLSDDMEMRYSFDGNNTNILVYSLEGKSFSNDFLQVNGSIVSSEFAADNGAEVLAKLMPSNFALQQNYPNPFNPTTNIAFEIPGGGAWKMQVYNITGQLVKTFNGVSESGFETVEWDASDLSSGIYFYRLTAGENSMTKKAVLLK